MTTTALPMATAAAAFQDHVELDEGVVATTAPLELKSLDRIILLVAHGLVRSVDLQQRVYELRERLMVARVIGAAEAIAGMLELLVAHKEAKEFFKGTIVHVLTGKPLPLRTLAFGGSGPAAAASATTTASLGGGAAHTPSKTVGSGSFASPTPTPLPSAQKAATFNSVSAAAAASVPATAATTATALTATAMSTASSAAGTPETKPPVSPAPVRVAAPAPAMPSLPQNFAPLPSSSSSSSPSSSLRKRSVDSTYSSSSEQPPPDSDRKGKKPATQKRKSLTTNVLNSSTAGTYPIKDRSDPSLHPIFSVPTQWEELHYKPVQVININAPRAKDQIEALRLASTPFVLEGYSGWMKFANDWVTGPKGSLDTDAFLHGLHDVKVPVIEKNYEDTNPIKTHLPLAYYVRNYWEKGKPDYYMHQWQFPLSPKAAKLLCYKCEELPVLGDNLLLYWLDAVRGDNPLQYFFMGQRNTNSRMHQDPGGLDITIAPIVGTKRVTMLHKSAAKMDCVHDQINFHRIDLDKSPLLAFVPAWRVDVQPGQMLFMPEGTFHACENITACLSYHRFHVDQVSMPGFLASFMAQDSPSINHAEILWNAVHDVMASLEENYHANGLGIDGNVDTLRKLDSLRALRHASRVLSLEETVPTGESWDWKKLLEDIDHLLRRIDPTALNQGHHHQQNHTKTKKQKKPAAVVDGEAAGDVSQEDEDEDDQYEYEDDDADAVLKGAASAVAAAAGTASSTVANVLAQSKKTLSSHWDDLKLKVGDTIGVQVFEKRNKAHVRKIALNIELVQIHYVDWGSIYDEFLPVGSLYQRSTRSSKRVPFRKAPKVHDTVLAKWGSTGQLYNAIVLKVIRSNACLVHYLKYENDWDQWVLPGHIFKKYTRQGAAKEGAGAS